jgi:hypothetical protein
LRATVELTEWRYAQGPLREPNRSLRHLCGTAGFGLSVPATRPNRRSSYAAERTRAHRMLTVRFGSKAVISPARKPAKQGVCGALRLR